MSTGCHICRSEAVKSRRRPFSSIKIRPVMVKDTCGEESGSQKKDWNPEGATENGVPKRPSRKTLR
jgi:hypothetical protein